VDEKVFKDKPTFKSFLDLMDNYVAITGVEEVVTEQERKENIKFINDIGDTDCIKYIYDYCKERGIEHAATYPKFKKSFCMILGLR